MKRLLLVPVLVVLAAHALTAAPAPPPESRTLSPYFFVKSDNPSVDRLPLKATSAVVDIAGVIARVKVVQVYRNEGRHALEAVYVFPGSTRAAVHGMTMKIGERVITARIEERQEARRQYAEALQSGRTASLLEQQRPNVFQMNVANILPGDEIRVELIYSELLVPERGVYEFVYPTVVGPRYSTTDAATAPEPERWVENPYLHQGEPPTASFDFKARIVAGMPLVRVASPSHEIKVEYAGPTRASVTLAAVNLPAAARGASAGVTADPGEGGPVGGGGAANRDVVLTYQLADARIETGLLLAPGADENFFVCMIEPPRRVVPAAIPPREYVFIMDVSGSMSGFPIETSKELLRNVLQQLGPHDYFNVLFFSGGTWVLSTTSVPANEGNKTWALQEIERQHGGGGTELLPALRQAFDLPRARSDVARSIVIATDGYVNVEREAFGLVRDRLGDASVFAFGIGTSVNRHLIEGLARVGEGAPFVVLNAAEARKTAARFLEYIQSPLLTRIQAQTPGFDVYDLEPAHLPDLFAERPLVLVGKYRGAATGEIVISGFTGQGRFERRVKVDGGRSAANDVLRVLWARERLALLSDLASGAPDAARKEITSLGLKYGLLTQFTSFVAVDQRVRRTNGSVETVKQPLPMPEGVTDLAIGESASKVRMVATEALAPGRPPLPFAVQGGALPGSVAQRADAPKSVPVVEVQVVENRIQGSGQWTVGSGQQANVAAAVRRQLEAAGCVASGTGAIRLMLVFGAAGAVERVEPGGDSVKATDCVKSSLKGLRLSGVTGGYAIVIVRWR